MVFSETLYEEEHIFEDYYLSDNVYFRLNRHILLTYQGNISYMDEVWKNVYLKSLQMNVIRKKICRMYVRLHF